MAAKKSAKQKTRKTVARTPKRPAHKTDVEMKSKTAPKKKAAAPKPAAVKPVPKSSSVKKQIKSAQRVGGIAPLRSAEKKISLTAKKQASAMTAERKAPQAGRRTSEKSSEEERRLSLRKSLIQKREEIVKEVKNEISKYIKGETRQLVDTALDDGDWSVVDLSEDISFKHMSTHRETLLKIDEALRKLSEGTYGICEDCGEKISEQRLKILPFAIYCTDCQEQREQLEEMEKREGLIG